MEEGLPSAAVLLWAADLRQSRLAADRPMEEDLPLVADHVAADRQGLVRPLTAAQRETEGSETC